MGAGARRLNKTANTVHTTFRIPTRVYLSCLLEPSKILDKIKTSNVIIIDEISMMTNYVLCAIEQRLKQATPLAAATPFHNKLILLIGDLIQLPPICKHTLQNDELICKGCHIMSAPCWSSAIHHHLSISIRHATDPEYLQFLNIIRTRQPSHEEIQTILSNCFVS
jgi:hypothetical protein